VVDREASNFDNTNNSSYGLNKRVIVWKCVENVGLDRCRVGEVCRKTD